MGPCLGTWGAQGCGVPAAPWYEQAAMGTAALGTKDKWHLDEVESVLDEAAELLSPDKCWVSLDSS